MNEIKKLIQNKINKKTTTKNKKKNPEQTLVFKLFVFKLFKKSIKDKYTQTCCVAREHYCVISTYICFQLPGT